MDRTRTWVEKRRSKEMREKRKMKIRNNNILSIEEEKELIEEMAFSTPRLSHGGSILVSVE